MRCSPAVLDLFVSSNGAKALVELLRLPAHVNGMTSAPHVYAECRQCLLTAVEGIALLLRQKLRLSRPDLCLLLSVSGVGQQLARATALFVCDPTVTPDFLDTALFVWGALTSCTTAGPCDVRVRLSDAAVVEGLFECLPHLRGPQRVQLLRCVLSLTEASDLRALSAARCVDRLVGVLGAAAEDGAAADAAALEAQEVALRATYNLCKAPPDRANWLAAAAGGLVRHLQRAARTGAPALVALAVPMLCDMVRAGPALRAPLTELGVAEFLLELLAADACRPFKVPLLNALSVWVRAQAEAGAEAARAEDAVLRPAALGVLAGTLVAAAAVPQEYAAVLELYGALCARPRLADGFAGSDALMQAVIDGLARPAPVPAGTRLALLRVLTRAYECAQRPQAFLRRHARLCGVLTALSGDPSQLIREHARRLLNAFASAGKASALLVP